MLSINSVPGISRTTKRLSKGNMEPMTPSVTVPLGMSVRMPPLFMMAQSMFLIPDNSLMMSIAASLTQFCIASLEFFRKRTLVATGLFMIESTP